MHTPSEIGIDTGGTFTDAVKRNGQIAKVPSRKDAPEEAIAMALQLLDPDGRAGLAHGTTIATNAVLESKLAKVGLVVNEGFRDLFTIRRQARPDLYAREPFRPDLPLDPRRIQTIAGRIDAAGVEIAPLDPAALQSLGARLLAAGATSIAVVLLHAWNNPVHERQVGEALMTTGLPITLSSALCREYREVERGTAAILNAGLAPIVAPYLARLEARIAPRRYFVMDSAGGLLTPAQAAVDPARLLVSGPAGGLVAAAQWAETLNEPLVLTLDMGGTSTDVALLQGGLPRGAALKIAGHEVRLPALAIETIGAGGGSLLCRDAAGGIRVGPESAGADPGPAAYGRGGGLTVTDANLLAGRIAPEDFAGGQVTLDLGAAMNAAEDAARALAMRPKDLIFGMLEIVDVAMLRALRRISLEEGKDPRSGALLCFGGAGGLHATSLARRLGLSRVLWPLRAGVLSAEGLLRAAPEQTRALTVLGQDLSREQDRKKALRALAGELIEEFRARGAKKAALRVTESFDLRYRGQSFELEVPAAPDLFERFHARHAERFGFAEPAASVEIVTMRVRVTETLSPLPFAAPKGRRRGPLRPRRELHAAIDPKLRHPSFERSDLIAGDEIEGPASVADETSSLWIDASSKACVHETGALILEVRP